VKRFISFGYIAMVVGGLVLAIGSLIEGLNRPGDPFSQQVTTSAFALSAGLRLIGAALALIGVIAICVRQADRAGRFGLAAYVLVVINMVMQLGSMWADLFVTDMLGRHAPALLDESSLQGRLGIGFMTAWLLNATFILLGIATLRARVFGRVVGWSLLAVGVITLLPLPFDGPWFEVLIGAGFALAGWFARSAGTDPVSSTGTAQTAAAEVPAR
jgi:hypothetical protein